MLNNTQNIFRYEFKYLIDERKTEEIKKYLAKVGLKNDEHHKDDYVVGSLYFETPYFGDYYDKMGGFLIRKKIRARWYGEDNSKIWMEIKNKYDMKIFKERLVLDDKQWKRFLNFKKTDTDSELTRKFSYLIKKYGYSPYVCVRYKRKAYVGQFVSSIRITFDSDIKACRSKDLVYNSFMIPVARGIVVMEVKFDYALPWWFKDMSARFQLSRQAFSKYSMSIDAINKFNPLPK